MNSTKKLSSLLKLILQPTISYLQWKDFNSHNSVKGWPGKHWSECEWRLKIQSRNKIGQIKGYMSGSQINVTGVYWMLLILMLSAVWERLWIRCTCGGVGKGFSIVIIWKASVRPGVVKVLLCIIYVPWILTCIYK